MLLSRAYNCDKIATNLNRNGTPISFRALTAHAKEFKAVHNSISKAIRVMVAKPEDSV